jgi:hypothetical protein
MPPSDLEAKGLFNYTDWDNHAYQDATRFLSTVPQAQRYGTRSSSLIQTLQSSPTTRFFGRRRNLVARLSLIGSQVRKRDNRKRAEAVCEMMPMCPHKYARREWLSTH